MRGLNHSIDADTYEGEHVHPKLLVKLVFVAKWEVAAVDDAGYRPYSECQYAGVRKHSSNPGEVTALKEYKRVIAKGEAQQTYLILAKTWRNATYFLIPLYRTEMARASKTVVARRVMVAGGPRRGGFPTAATNKLGGALTDATDDSDGSRPDVSAI